MECKFRNEFGEVSVTEEVLSVVAGYSAIDCYGIVAMASKRATDGIVELLGRDNLSRGVRIRVSEDVVSVDLYVIVEYGVSISAVARSAIENVKYNLETLTGMTIGTVNVTVEGIRV